MGVETLYINGRSAAGFDWLKRQQVRPTVCKMFCGALIFGPSNITVSQSLIQASPLHCTVHSVSLLWTVDYLHCTTCTLLYFNVDIGHYKMHNRYLIVDSILSKMNNVHLTVASGH